MYADIRKYRSSNPVNTQLTCGIKYSKDKYIYIYIYILRTELQGSLLEVAQNIPLNFACLAEMEV